MTTPLKTILVVLALPKSVIAALIARMYAILDAMAANTATFPTPPVALATATTHLVALQNAERATTTRAPGSVALRNAARDLVVADAKQLHAYVQQLCNATPAEAQAIAEHAAMTLRKKAVRKQSDLTVKQGVSGSVTALAKTVKGATAHEWQYSTDGGKTWISATPTSQAKTVLSNLPPGVLQFRQRVITRKGPGDWTSPLTMAVS